MNSLLFICCVLIMITMGECFHRSFFDGIQEIETVSISHTFVHRTRRRASLRNTAVMPDVIVTEIKGDNQHSYLKFHRNRKKTLSPLFTLEVGLGLVEKKITVHCTHFYEDINHSAHAILDSCGETGSIKVVAEVALNNELYMILPKDSQKADESFQHGLFKVNTTRDYSHDYRVPTENTNEENSIPSVNDRFRRQTERNYVELQLVIDYSLYTFWYGLTTGTQLEREAAALDLIQKMYAFLGNGVHLRYKGLQTTYGIDIDVELTSVYVLKTSEESAITENVDFTFSSRGTVDAETLLNSFKSWIDEQSVSNPDNILNADHFMLLTGREIVLSGNADAAGLLRTMILSSKRCPIVQAF
ncbi:uncharacterized protein LOC128550826 [Mercenaria mercenaria]|uniref:uncharacterized protein LOC128550826 n=1 Tax=Mercenaria mercenaria TaxID=6596 RepID=UPI00234E69F0|nr:uncharacterized protein LOC128550826 [Mercenaria mercenaria]